MPRFALLVLVLSALAVADDSYGGVIPPDITAIINKMKQTGRPPTAAERARLQQWQQEMAGKRGADLKGKAEQRRDEMLQGQPPNTNRRRSSADQIGFVIAHYTMRGVVDDGREKSTTTITGEARIPVKWTLNDLGAAYSVTFTTDDKRRCAGSFFTNSHKQDGDEIEDDKLTFAYGSDATSEVGNQCMAMGEVLSDPTLKRPMIRAQLFLTGAQKGTIERQDSDGKHTVTVDQPSGAPLVGISLDDIIPAKFAQQGLTPELAKMMGGTKYDAATTAAIAGIKFDLDVEKLKKAIEKGGRFDVSGTYSYVLEKPKESRMEYGVRWQFVGDPGEPELYVRAENRQTYEKWLPEPFSDDAEAKQIFSPQPLTFEVGLSTKPGASDAQARKAKLVITLEDVTEHGGLTTNWPVKGKSKKDLRFAKDQPDLEITPDGLTATTKKEVSKVSVRVEALDTGAYGKLTAKAPSLELTAEDPDTGYAYVKIPNDENGNHVADAWEDQLGLPKNLERQSDEDDQMGQRRKGDGYTLFEEYRGFVVLEDFGKTKKTFLRTDPRKKDIFVWDKDTLFAQYYVPYNAQAANLELHAVDNHLMETSGVYDANNVFSGSYADPEHRWMTPNSLAEERYAKQYAIVVLRDDKFVDEDGNCIGAEARELNWNSQKGVFHQALKSFPEIRMNTVCFLKRLPIFELDQGTRWTEEQEDAAIPLELRTSMIHEFGHVLGIHHHFPDGRALPPYSSDWKLSMYKGGKIAWGGEAGNSGGVRNCSMRYQTAEIDKKQFRDEHTWYAPIHYCRASDSPMKKGAKSDDCWSQIDVKMDP
jgi:hypothetical protein